MSDDPTNPRFDRPYVTPTQFAGSTEPAARTGRGARARQALAAQGRTLVDRLLAAYRAGGLTPAEVAVLQALLGWVAGRGGEEAAGAARVIVAVTHPGDDHLPPVRRALHRRGVRLEVLDLADLAAGWRLEMGDDPSRWALARAGARRGAALRRIDARSVRAVWWRRLSPLGVAPGLAPADAAYARVQYGEALSSFWRGAGLRLVDDPLAVEAALSKPLQLLRAQAAGLAVPPTLVTDDPAKARAFLERHPRAIHKPLQGLADQHLTRRVDAAARRGLAAIRAAPVIFQRFVPGVDVRVTAIGGRLFGCEIDARRTASPQDFRPVFRQAKVRPCAVPRPVAASIRALLGGYRLSYGALDFRRAADGGWTFLELNPGGQWLRFAERAGQPVAEALADHLLGAPRA